MYEEFLEKYNPKPIWNLDYYKNDDQYSDGDIEDRIVEIIAENEPEQYTEAIDRDFSWPVYYHLTRTRRNLLSWYDFKPESDVLEIGCGFGAISGLLCDKCKSVTAVELSQRRAIGALLRCREKENLEIIVGNLNDIEFGKKFDYITLIGVLEYQGRFTDSDNPYKDFLMKIKKLLKPDGKLLIAIENQYGLKYWCGAGEDHTGVPFDGMNQYIYTNQGIRTFSKAGLDGLIHQSGFKNTYFYYPMPDYKLPTVIYSADYLPKDENMQNVELYYSRNDKSLIADEKRMYKDIIANNTFEFFANSFMVECTDVDDIGNIRFASLCDDRVAEYQLGTKIYADSEVRKYALCDKGGEHIRQTVQNEMDIAAHGLNVMGSKMIGKELAVSYTENISFEQLFVDICRHGDEEEVVRLVEVLYDQILHSSELVDSEENLIYALLPETRDNGVDYGPIMRNGYLDMTFKNAFINDGELYWYDQEWMLENIPADYIVFRALGTVYFSYSDINDMIPMEWLIRKCGMDAEWSDFIRLEAFFSASIRDELHIKEGAAFKRGDETIFVNNIKKLMEN